MPRDLARWRLDDACYHRRMALDSEDRGLHMADFGMWHCAADDASRARLSWVRCVVALLQAVSHA